MKEFKGTPGEWNYSHARGEVVSKPEGLIAELVVNGREDNNGSLIAAAPDLLEALQSIIELQTRGYVVLGDKYTDMPRAAISKALGEE
ncbi:hypothetical protein [Enterobacter asburiae]|uniref:hypothetical protein n=1 Tax=Enterobacter asburiae TaxID=61645 RepID=UPI001F429010|nr:hypothetical protein [Enterobacter asburiae]